ncbi:MAG: type II toxin-antitoxin system HipA family toxin [Gemmatimonadales bacterium]
MNRPARPSAAGQGQKVKLIGLLDGVEVGAVHQRADGRLIFSYDDEWLRRDDAYPLSLSMPLAANEHPHSAIHPWLWGLLPDNARTLANYGRVFGVSASNPVALLAHIGADCAGAVQFAPPEMVASLLSATARRPQVEWLSEEEIAAELRTVREQGIPGSDARTAGQFSLAGAQPKIALLESARGWGRPHGRTPTNRILKPPSREFAGLAENEHFCLELARRLEIGAVRSRVVRFGDEIAIVVDRFDRQEQRGRYHRVHQEDTCQALGVLPGNKYENEGGPGIGAVILLVREYSQRPAEDVRRFLSATALNWILAAPDAHAKNYALLLGPHAAVRLAPFYDIISYLPYADSQLHRVNLAMKIGRERLVRRIQRRSWEQLADAVGMPRLTMIDVVIDTIAAVSANVESVQEQAAAEGLDPAIIGPLARQIRARAAECLKQIGE